MSLPYFILDAYPTAVVLIVRGDSLALDGIRDGDLLVVDSRDALQPGGLCAVRIDGILCASTFMSTERLVLRTISGRSEVLAPSDVEIVGSVVCTLEGCEGILRELRWPPRRLANTLAGVPPGASTSTAARLRSTSICPRAELWAGRRLRWAG